MIPETGTRTELKAAWFEAISAPLPGEVYQWVDYSNVRRELWAVREINRLGMIIIDTYVWLDSSYFRRSIIGSSSKLSEWRRCIMEGEVRYFGTEVPVTGGRVVTVEI